jgi:hypothetical protein
LSVLNLVSDFVKCNHPIDESSSSLWEVYVNAAQVQNCLRLASVYPMQAAAASSDREVKDEKQAQMISQHLDTQQARTCVRGRLHVRFPIATHPSAKKVVTCSR